MNRISAIALFAAASLAAVHSASAQKTLSVAKVPFSFTVDGTTLPAGTYTVSSLTPTLLQIRSNDFEHPMAVSIAVRDSGKMNQDRQAELVFEAYGSQYFLHEIVAPPSSTDVVVPASKLEKQARMEWVSKGGNGPVQIALK